MVDFLRGRGSSSANKFGGISRHNCLRINRNDQSCTDHGRMSDFDAVPDKNARSNPALTCNLNWSTDERERHVAVIVRLFAHRQIPEASYAYTRTDKNASSNFRTNKTSANRRQASMYCGVGNTKSAWNSHQSCKRHAAPPRAVPPKRARFEIA